MDRPSNEELVFGLPRDLLMSLCSGCAVTSKGPQDGPWEARHYEIVGIRVVCVVDRLDMRTLRDRTLRAYRYPPWRG